MGSRLPAKDVERKEFATCGQAIHQAGSVFIEPLSSNRDHTVQPVDSRNDPFSYCIEDNLCCAMKPELLHHVGPVRLDGRDTQIQEVSDVFVGPSFRQ